MQFGSDFDHIFTTFPRGPFNTGMRVNSPSFCILPDDDNEELIKSVIQIAQWIDPATRYEETPESGRPYIMSPYCACMNSLAAYPAPSSYSKALLLAHHGHEEHAEDEDDDMIPMSTSDGAGARKDKEYWRFVGVEFTKSLTPQPSTSH